MFNLNVDELQTYSVTKFGILVHNRANLANGASIRLRRGVENIEELGSFSAARNAARGRANLGDDAVDFVQELGPLKGQVSGRMSPDGLRGWRVDWDDVKGFHVNWWDRTGGNKRGSWLYGAIKVPSKSYGDFGELLSHFPK